MRDVNPAFLAGTAGEFFTRGIPFQRLAVVVGQIHEMTDRGGAGAGFDIANGFPACAKIRSSARAPGRPGR